MISARGGEIGRNCTWGSAQMQSRSLLLLSDSEAIVGQEGREGETQPQLEFSLLCSAASLAVPRSKTAKLF